MISQTDLEIGDGCLDSAAVRQAFVRAGDGRTVKILFDLTARRPAPAAVLAEQFQQVGPQIGAFVFPEDSERQADQRPEMDHVVVAVPGLGQIFHL